MFAIVPFSGATVARHAQIIEAGLGSHVSTREAAERWPPLVYSDQKWVGWVVSRNVRTFAPRPWALFEAEQCFRAGLRALSV